uniref:Uncharacterized protein n=1 Tax=Caenorhabditis japonica TaxID=281687 RepID=A0A8R1HU07_CAEJA
MEQWNIFFGRVAEELCEDEEWASKNNEQCWNGTDVGSYDLPTVNFSQPFANPEYQGADFLSFRGNYIEERLRLHWLNSRIVHILSGRYSQDANKYVTTRAEAMVDDEDYSDYEEEGSGSVSTSHKYSPYFERKDNTIDIVIEPYSAKSFAEGNCCFSVVIVIFCIVNHVLEL